MLGRMRASALQSSCANNLRAMGAGLSTYANDHRDFLPVTAGLSSLLSPNPSTLDWNTYEHSGNLVAMANKGYCSMSAMQCPACASGTPHKHFAFRMPASDRPFRLKVVARGALVADANPALELRRAGKPAASLVSLMPGAKAAKLNNAGGGHYNHCLLWNTMSANAGGEPKGVLADKMMAAFGSYDKFKEQFSQYMNDDIETLLWHTGHNIQYAIGAFMRLNKYLPREKEELLSLVNSFIGIACTNDKILLFNPFLIGGPNGVFDI
jgi:hypothetical protein